MSNSSIHKGQSESSSSEDILYCYSYLLNVYKKKDKREKKRLALFLGKRLVSLFNLKKKKKEQGDA
jgi:hypothetical protein